MTKICKKHFDQLTTKSFINSKFTSYKVNQKFSMYLLILAIFSLVASFSFVQFADAGNDRTRLEGELVNPSTGKDDGKAKFEQRDDRATFSVEIEAQESNSVFEIRVDGVILGTFSTDDSGFADYNLDSRDGDSIPNVRSGSMIEVIDSRGKVVLSGSMVGTESMQDPGTQTPTSETDPVSTTTVIIPFGAKDKDVTEFYSPRSISVNLGETVSWTNQDDADHTVTSKISGIFNSGIFGTSQSFSHQFSEDGTFEYFCQLHPWMVGTVVAGKGGDVPISEPAPQPTTDPNPTPASTPSTPQGSSQFTVTIPSGAAAQTITPYYSPNSISIKISDSVLWKNSDIGFHTVTSGKAKPDGLFDSGLFGPGETFTRQFSLAGTIEYFCVVHPWMTGSVTVASSEKTTQDDTSDAVLSPLKQMKNGVLPIDIVCNPGKNLLFKASDNMPVCLYVKSIPKLQDRGWAKII